MAKKLTAAGGAFLVLGLAIPALADTNPETEQVTVSGPFTIQREIVLRPLHPDGRDTVKLTVSKGVAYSDLDLSKPADVDMLRERVKQAAHDTCTELSLRFPPLVYVPESDESCEKNTTRDALAKIDELIGHPNTVASAK